MCWGVCEACCLLWVWHIWGDCCNWSACRAGAPHCCFEISSFSLLPRCGRHCSITVTVVTFGAFSVLSPHFQASFSSATSPVSTLVLLSIWMTYCSFSFCLLFSWSLCSRLPYPEGLRCVREGGEQSRETGVVVAWKRHSKAPRRSHFCVCNTLTHAL